MKIDFRRILIPTLLSVCVLPALGQELEERVGELEA